MALYIDDKGINPVAKWAYLKQVYRSDSERLVKLPDQDETSGKATGLHLPKSFF